MLHEKFIAAFILLDRPFYERSILGFAHVSFLFFPTHFFRRLQTDCFEAFPHDVALLEKEALNADFLKVPLTKMRGENPQISPNIASNRNILCAVTRNVEGK